MESKRTDNKLLKELTVELTPYEFEGYSNCKDTVVRFYDGFVEITFIFDYAEEQEQEDDILGTKTVRLSSSTFDVIYLDKNSIVEISYMKQLLADPEDEDKKYNVWSAVISNLGGSIKIRCKNKAVAAEVVNTIIDWKYSKGEFNEQQQVK